MKTYIHIQPTVGELNPQSKLTRQEVRHIVRCVRNGVDRREIAALFGVSVKHVGNICNGRHWREFTVNERYAT